MSELLPCPWCQTTRLHLDAFGTAGETDADLRPTDWRVMHDEGQEPKCEAWGPECDTREQALAAWNRRAPSADIEALRQKYQADMHQCIADVGLWAQKSGQLEGERDAVAIAFQKLSAVLRVNMLRWVPGTSHGEIDAAIDACLGPVARRVLSDHIPDAGKMVEPPHVKDCLTTHAAYAAGAEAMRERAAEQVDCGCSWRADALAATNKGERFVACGNDPCGAIEARAIRALPLPAAPEGEG